MKVHQLTPILLLLVSLVPMACTSNPEQSRPRAESDDVVRIQNGDRTLSLSEAPNRAVTLNHNGTELLLALGLEDRMVGTAFKDHSILSRFRDEYDSIPVLSEQYPSLEVLLNADPDFVYGWQTAFQPPQGPATIERLEQLEVTPYLDRMYADTTIQLEDVYEEIHKLGRVFRVRDRSDSLVRKLQQRVQTIRSRIPGDSDPIPVAVYSNGTDSFYGAGTGLISDLLRTVNARNVLEDDISTNYGSISWEKIVEENPEYIVILDYGSIPFGQKKENLLSRASLSEVEAIRKQNFIKLPLAAMFVGIRTVRGLHQLARGLHPDRHSPETEESSRE